MGGFQSAVVGMLEYQEGKYCHQDTLNVIFWPYKFYFSPNFTDFLLYRLN